MATFAEIVKESEATRRDTYMLQAGNSIFRAPSKEQEEQEAIDQLKQDRENERRQRAREMAARCTPEYLAMEPDISSILPEPKYITQTDGSLPLMVSLIRKIVQE